MEEFVEAGYVCLCGELEGPTIHMVAGPVTLAGAPSIVIVDSELCLFCAS